jgi:hypothetical protein
MDPIYVLAQRFTESSLQRKAHSALPDAPVQPPAERRRHLRRSGRRTTSARR